ITQNKSDSALFYIQEADKYISGESDGLMLARFNHLYGKSLYMMNRFDEAETRYENAIRYGKEISDTLLIANCFNDLGRMYKKQSAYSKALNHFNEARQYYFYAGDSSGIALVSLNVGNVLKSIGQTELAKVEYRKALSYFIRSGDEPNQAGVYNNLGNIFKNDKQYDSSFYFMYKTLGLRKKGTSKTGLAFIYHNLANLHLANHNTDSALYYITLSFNINSELHSETDLAFDYNVFGSIYLEMGNYAEAVKNLESAYNLIVEDGLSENKLDILRQLGVAHYKNGNSKKSADYFIEYFQQTDSLQIINQNSFIESELMRYTLFADSLKANQLKLERDLELVKKDNTELANRINFRNYLYGYIILFLILAIVAVFFINARRRLAQTRAHEAVLEVQNEELKRTLISKEEKEILLKEVHHRVKNNLQIINSLIRLQANFMNAKNFREKLMETENRIRSMALIHEKLYKTGNLASLSVRNYIEELSFNILESYENHKVKIRLKFDLEEKEYGIDTLIPLGLIINEVLSNSIKHAFFERDEGNIFISIHSEGNRSVMKISDDGIGADLSFEELKEDSLGLELIDSLCEQLDGKLELNTENGFNYTFEFKILK
ncbi:MAG: tetratricopeptide repeat protein, partial [Crocinitomicaceae bacterium]|nr:tetratricopeptide repeat protein [Crocinitomicaceae bacterium]